MDGAMPGAEAPCPDAPGVPEVPGAAADGITGADVGEGAVDPFETPGTAGVGGGGTTEGVGGGGGVGGGDGVVGSGTDGTGMLTDGTETVGTGTWPRACAQTSAAAIPAASSATPTAADLTFVPTDSLAGVTANEQGRVRAIVNGEGV